MQRTTTVAALLLLATTSAALADDDCNVPMADWQPRETLRQQLEQQHPDWDVHRIKVDDGCYEIKATDADGNEIEAEYAPDTLRIRKLEIDYRYDSDKAKPDGVALNPSSTDNTKSGNRP
ncbi:MAG TPA: PepSY domain-containing protein, partial [Wenzhouxiangella sp.]|nr:PepSY domain-containing protein [Wenzhouxiangella sp.]